MRNRRRVLDAARLLTAEHGITAVTMDDIADAAGVGKGTVYRAFNGRGRIAEALLDDAERALQQEVLQGDPPLGPGAEPSVRLRAFADHYLQFLDANTELLIETDRHLPAGRFGTGAHAFWQTHVAALADEIRCRQPQITAELILALLAPDLHDHLRRELGILPDDARDHLIDAISALAETAC